MVSEIELTGPWHPVARMSAVGHAAFSPRIAGSSPWGGANVRTLLIWRRDIS